jgi:ferredoxin
MIVAERKKIPELLETLRGHKKILALGCGTCVTVCLAGGEREVSIISSALRIASKIGGHDFEIDEMTIERQCDNVFIEEAAETIEKNDVVLSLACGAGVQALAERYFDKPVYAGLNTSFIGVLEERGVWKEKCSACGACELNNFGGICPITRCAKSLLNGPCGGSQNGHCEISPDQPCAWLLIYERLKSLGQLDRLMDIQEPKDWSDSLSGGCRTIIREDHRI